MKSDIFIDGSGNDHLYKDYFSPVVVLKKMQLLFEKYNVELHVGYYCQYMRLNGDNFYINIDPLYCLLGVDYFYLKELIEEIQESEDVLVEKNNKISFLQELMLILEKSNSKIGFTINDKSYMEYDRYVIGLFVNGSTFVFKDGMNVKSIDDILHPQKEDVPVKPKIKKINFLDKINFFKKNKGVRR